MLELIFFPKLSTQLHPFSKHPETIDFEKATSVACAMTIPKAVVASNAKKTSLNKNLNHLMLIPKNESGVSERRETA